MGPKTDCHHRYHSIGRLFLVFFLFFWIVACAVSTDRRHPDFSVRIAPIKTLCILPADVIVYEEMADGRLLHRSDWSRAAQEDLKRTLVDELMGRDYRVLTFPESELSRDAELQEILTLYRAVNKSIQLHTFGPDIFPAKKAQFNYSVGSLNALRESNEADGFVFARVLYRVSDQQARSYVSLGLADGTGTILWYGANGASEADGGRSFDRTLILVKKILVDFPEGRL